MSLARPLFWRKSDGHPQDGDEGKWVADGLAGRYSADKQRDGTWLLWWAHDNFVWEACATFAEVKQKAEADWQARFAAVTLATPANGEQVEREQFAKNANKSEPVNFMETATRRVVFNPPAHVTPRMVAQLVAGEPVDGGTDVPKDDPYRHHVHTDDSLAFADQISERHRLRANAAEAAIEAALAIFPDADETAQAYSFRVREALWQAGANAATPTEDARSRVKVLEEARKRISTSK